MSILTKFIGFIGFTIPLILLISCNQENRGAGGVFEVDLQAYAALSDGRSGAGKVHHWRLNIPNEYIFETSGKNGMPNSHWSNERKNRQVIKMFVTLDQETGQINPHQNMKVGGGEGFININLANAVKRQPGPYGDKCKTRYELLEEAGVAKLENKESYVCSLKNCPVFTTYEGWSFNISMRKKLYDEREKTCSIVKGFLDELTIKRDVIPGFEL